MLSYLRYIMLALLVCPTYEIIPDFLFLEWPFFYESFIPCYAFWWDVFTHNSTTYLQLGGCI